MEPTPILQPHAPRGPRRARSASLARAVRRAHDDQERVGPIFEVMKHAARNDAEVAELYARAQQNRYVNLEAVARMLVERGGLRPGLTVEDAGQTIWVLASPETRHMLEAHAGWSANDYRKWLADTLIATLLPRR